MTSVLFRSDNLLVKQTGSHGSASCVVTFDSYTDFRTLDRPGFGEAFLEQHGVDAIHIISRDNDWYQYEEMHDALAAARSTIGQATKVVTYGSSMGGYAALRFASSVGAKASIAISPQFSIDPTVVPFERRWYDDATRIQFLWEGDPPPEDHEAFIFYDPHDPDARHVSLFEQRFKVCPVRLPHAGHPAGAYLAETKLLSGAILDIVNGVFDSVALEQLIRQRRWLSGQYLHTLSQRVSPRRSQLRLELSHLAVRAAPENAAYISNFANSLASAGCLGEAEQQHLTAIALAPDHPVIQHHYAVFLQRVGELTRARAVAEKVLTVAPQVPVFRVHLQLIDQVPALGSIRTAISAPTPNPLVSVGGNGEPAQSRASRTDTVAWLKRALSAIGRKCVQMKSKSDQVPPLCGCGNTNVSVDELVTTTPSPPPFAASWQRHHYLIQTAPSKSVDVVLIGDSLAHFWPEHLWQPRTVFNLGIAADRTQHVLWRLQAPELSKLSPKDVLIVVGTNNLASGDSPIGIAAGVRAVMRRAELVWPQARVQSLEVPPCGPGFAFNASERKEANSILAKTRRTINVDQELTCGFREPCSNYEDDQIHFSESGYRLLTDIVIRKMAEL